MNQLPDELNHLVMEFLPRLTNRLIIRQLSNKFKSIVDDHKKHNIGCSGLHTSLMALRLCKCSVKNDIYEFSSTIVFAERIPLCIIGRVQLIKDCNYYLNGNSNYTGDDSILRALVQRKRSSLICNSIIFGCVYTLLLSRVSVYYLWEDLIQLRLLMMIYIRFGIYNRIPMWIDWCEIYNDAIDWLPITSLAHSTGFLDIE
jgi:hypothetical protein